MGKSKIKVETIFSKDEIENVKQMNKELSLLDDKLDAFVRKYGITQEKVCEETQTIRTTNKCNIYFVSNNEVAVCPKCKSNNTVKAHIIIKCFDCENEW